VKLFKAVLYTVTVCCGALLLARSEAAEALFGKSADTASQTQLSAEELPVSLDSFSTARAFPGRGHEIDESLAEEADDKGEKGRSSADLVTGEGARRP